VKFCAENHLPVISSGGGECLLCKALLDIAKAEAIITEMIGTIDQMQATIDKLQNPNEQPNRD
jgi:hypothetical protein